MLVKVLIAISLAIVAGWASGPTKQLYGVTFLQIYSLIGQFFLNGLNLVVVPLVAASIITGTARIGKDRSFYSLGKKTGGYFFLTSLAAILIGLLVASVIQPGNYYKTVSPLTSETVTQEVEEIEQQTKGKAFDKIAQIMLSFVPSNIVSAAAQGQLLGLIIFCMLFGFFISKINPDSQTSLINFWQGVLEIMMQITHLIIKALPFGVFGLVAKSIATTGLEAIGSVLFFFMTVLVGFAFYLFIFLPLLLKFVAKVNPLSHFRLMLPAMITGFSTTSSAATLPVTLECVEKKAGVSNRLSSFILPLGASVNLSGSALYVCIAVLFIAQSYGIELGFSSLFIVVLMTFISSLGTAGIPSASLFSVIVILHALDLPADGIGLIMTVERLLDMFRTPVNIFGTSCCAILVASSEGEAVLREPIHPITHLK